MSIYDRNIYKFAIYGFTRIIIEVEADTLEEAKDKLLKKDNCLEIKRESDLDLTDYSNFDWKSLYIAFDSVEIEETK